MKSFNVLDRNTDIHRHYIIEASAGTGKTFAIENFVVRLLLEEDPTTHEILSLEQILVVTFTRAAVRDLKTRIRNNIDNSLACLNDCLHEMPQDASSIPDYIQHICQQGQQRMKAGKKRLEQALSCFDQAQIYTIHSFCARMLKQFGFEGDLALDAIASDDSIPRTKVLEVIRDYFRTGLYPNLISPGQLKILLKDYKQDMQKLEINIFSMITKGIEIAETFDYSNFLEKFQTTMQRLGKLFSSDKITEDFIFQAPSYKGLTDRKKNIKKDSLDTVQRFAKLFNKDAWDSNDFDQLLNDGLFLVEALDERNIAANKKIDSTKLNYPYLTTIIKTELEPIVAQAANPNVIFSQITRGCQKHLKRYLAEEEKLGFDDFLQVMLQSMQNANFVKSIRQKYRLAIIDEFQDTDPVQWKIFHNLFFQGGHGRLCLVGDPKQSIYAFRQADIYTYLSAVELLGEGNRASLDTNYRSQPSLVEGLNRLFQSASAKQGLMDLPSLESSLPYHDVKAGFKDLRRVFSDHWGAVHFAIVESEKSIKIDNLEAEYFLPFIVQEIQRLTEKDGFGYNQIAILIADRFQSERAAVYLKKFNIPVQSQRGSSLADSPALAAMQEMLKAVFNPRHESSVRVALGGKIIGWTHSQIRELTDQKTMESVLLSFYSLSKRLNAFGFAAFFEQLLQSSWHPDGKSIEERMLMQEGGIEFYSDLQQIADLLIEYSNHSTPTFDRLCAFLDDFKTMQIDDDERLKKRIDPNQNAVHILTIHSSKGLEYDIVFPLGLIKRSPAPNQMIPAISGGTISYVAVTDKSDELYLSHCKECDAEKMRQLYVALTRAKYRVYIPVSLTAKDESIDPGTASPMDLFLRRLSEDNPTAIKEIIHNISSDQVISASTLNDAQFYLNKHQPQNQSIQLSPPPQIHVPGTQQLMLSFTTLSKGSKQSASTEAFDVGDAPHDFNESNKTPHTLPAGSDTGTLLHLIMQKIPFGSAMQSDESFNDHIRRQLDGSSFSTWEDTIQQIVYNALNVPIRFGQVSLRLLDLMPHQMYREMEFLYPIDGNKKIAELELSSGYLKGIIDLIFEYEGKYYIIDWKSNWLGPGQEYYNHESLKASMQENEYDLQAEIYANALERFLKIVDKRHFHDIFGGVYYLYLRGIDGKSSQGIFGVRRQGE
jgi:exodeoxyribonuclease V beta subunit